MYDGVMYCRMLDVNYSLPTELECDMRVGPIYGSTLFYKTGCMG